MSYKKPSKSNIKNEIENATKVDLKKDLGNLKNFKSNAGSARGNLKNALLISKYAPTPTSKIVVFLLVFFIPMILGFILFFGFLLISSGAMVSVLVKDPEVVKKFTGVEDSATASGNSSLNRVDVGVPPGLEGKFLLTWNLGQLTSIQQSNRCIGGECAPHRGVDLQPSPLPAWSGSQPKEQRSLYLYPTYPGEVVFSTDNNYNKKPFLSSSYGNLVLIKHEINGKNYYTLYAHLYQTFVKEGDVVDYFDKIGRMGCTGRSFGNFLGCGAHLHFEIRGPEFFNGKNYVGSKGELPVGSLITCGANGEKLGNTAGSKAKCIEYTEKVLGGKPSELK